MKTQELIELADDCAVTYCDVCEHYKVNCWGYFDLIEKLRNRLEKAVYDLTRFAECDVDCITCKYCNTECPKNREYKWRGDE